MIFSGPTRRVCRGRVLYVNTGDAYRAADKPKEAFMQYFNWIPIVIAVLEAVKEEFDD